MPGFGAKVTGSMLYSIHLDVFQGPLDLLLMLLKEEDIPLNSVPVAEISSAWVYFSQEGERDLEALEEFLLLVSEILALKARLLLRPEESGEEEEEEPDGLEDVWRKAQEYRVFQDAASKLLELRKKEAAFTREPDPSYAAKMLALADPLAGITLSDLVRSVCRVLERQRVEEEQPKSLVYRPRISLVHQQRLILLRLRQARRRLTFSSFLTSRPTRLEVAATFLALLELVRRGRVNLYQGEPFGEIEVWLRE